MSLGLDSYSTPTFFFEERKTPALTMSDKFKGATKSQLLCPLLPAVLQMEVYVFTILYSYSTTGTSSVYWVYWWFVNYLKICLFGCINTCWGLFWKWKCFSATVAKDELRLMQTLLVLPLINERKWPSCHGAKGNVRSSLNWSHFLLKEKRCAKMHGSPLTFPLSHKFQRQGAVKGKTLNPFQWGRWIFVEP